MISVYGMTAADPIRPLRWQDLVWLVLSGVLAWGFSLLSGAWRLLPLVSCGAFVFWQQASYADADLLWQETRNRKSLALFLQDFSFLNYCRFQNPFVSFALSRIHSRQFARILSIAGCLLPMLWLPRRAAWVLLAPVFAMVIGQLTHDSLAVMCLLWAWGCPIPLVSGVLLAVTLWVKPVALLAVIACALTHGWMTIMVCLLVTPWYVLAFRTEYWMRKLWRECRKNSLSPRPRCLLPGSQRTAYRIRMTTIGYYGLPLLLSGVVGWLFLLYALASPRSGQTKYLIWGVCLCLM